MQLIPHRVRRCNLYANYARQPIGSIPDLAKSLSVSHTLTLEHACIQQDLTVNSELIVSTDFRYCMFMTRTKYLKSVIPTNSNTNPYIRHWWWLIWPVGRTQLLAKVCRAPLAELSALPCPPAYTDHDGGDDDGEGGVRSVISGGTGSAGVRSRGGTGGTSRRQAGRGRSRTHWGGSDSSKKVYFEYAKLQWESERVS